MSRSSVIEMSGQAPGPAPADKVPSAMASSSSTRFLESVDPDAPLFVATATLASSCIGAASGASIGVVRSMNPFALSVNMGLNCGLAGMTFFGLREYIISPLLVSSNIAPSYTRRYLQLSEKARGKLPENYGAGESQSLSIGEVRLERVLDSGLAGGVAGGVLSAFIRGRRTIFRAALTASIATTLLQLSVNQLRVVRIQLLARRNPETQSEHPQQQEIPGDSAASTSLLNQPVRDAPPGSGSSSLPSTPSSSRSSSPSRDLPLTRVTSESQPPSSDPSVGPTLRESFENPLTRPTREQEAKSLPGKLLRGISTILPVQRLTDDEYLALMERKRREVDKRLGEIDAEEIRIFEWEQKRRAAAGFKDED